MKNSVALSVGDQVFISQYIGDLETEHANAAFRRVAADLPRLYDAPPRVIAADLHPDYLSTQFAQERGCPQPQQPVLRTTVGESARFTDAGTAAAGDSRAPQVIHVQHHIAHVLSCLAENEVELPALGVAWDGTGYGTDGTIWGGEFFLVTEDAVDRVASLRPFRLPGGDAAVKEPRRAALGLLHELTSHRASLLSQVRQKVSRAFSTTELATLESMLAWGVNSPLCSSVGRLFDTVAFLAGLRDRVRFEGQAAMELEFALDGVESGEHYELPLVARDSLFLLDWSPMILAMVDDLRGGALVGEVSIKFHDALVEALVQVALRVGCPRVALSGGCFQNRYLTEHAVTRLRDEGFQPYWHQRVPPNDGGIALGQVVAARRQLKQQEKSCVLQFQEKLNASLATIR